MARAFGRPRRHSVDVLPTGPCPATAPHAAIPARGRKGAASAPGSPANGRRTITFALALLFAATCVPVRAQPAAPVVFANGVVNAASFLQPPAAGSGLAQGSLISIFGANLGPEAGVSADFPLSNVLAGVSVEIQTAGGGVLAALPLFVSSTQINALLPSATPVGQNTLAVRRDGVASSLVPFTVVGSSFGLFVSPGIVVSAAAAQRFVSENETPVVTRQAPATPGETVVLWGTGLGPVDGSETAAPQATAIDTPIEVMVGQRSAAILYQGRSPCCAGLDQINIRVPDDAPAGCFVPLWIAVRGSLYSNIATIPISQDGSACRETPAIPTPLPGAAVGRLLLRRAVDVDDALHPLDATTRDRAIGWFSLPSEVTPRAGSPFPRQTGTVVALGLLQAAGLPALPPEGTCLVYAAEAGELVYRLDAGEAIELEGPAGRTTIPWTGSEYRLEAPPEALFLGPGSYRVSGPGGSGFPPFSTEMSVEEPAQWTAKGDSEGEARLRGLPIEWTAPAEGVNSMLLVGRDTVPGSGSEDLAPARFVCAASAAAQRFVIPPAVLANLPDTATALELGGLWAKPFELSTGGPETGAMAYLDAQLSSVRLGQPPLPSTPVTLPDGTQIEAELAASFVERQRGLMFRRELPADRGMLFLFENPGHYGFWMLNTLVPLDIVWLDSERRVVFISANTPPCPAGTFCPTYGSEATAQFVLELAAGQAAAHGLTLGGQFEW